MDKQNWLGIQDCCGKTAGKTAEAAELRFLPLLALQKRHIYVV